jgi:hypothetical protein
VGQNEASHVQLNREMPLLVLQLSQITNTTINACVLGNAQNQNRITPTTTTTNNDTDTDTDTDTHVKHWGEKRYCWRALIKSEETPTAWPFKWHSTDACWFELIGHWRERDKEVAH